MKVFNKFPQIPAISKVVCSSYSENNDIFFTFEGFINYQCFIKLYRKLIT